MRLPGSRVLVFPPSVGPGKWKGKEGELASLVASSAVERTIILRLMDSLKQGIGAAWGNKGGEGEGIRSLPLPYRPPITNPSVGTH